MRSSNFRHLLWICVVSLLLYGCTASSKKEHSKTDESKAHQHKEAGGKVLLTIEDFESGIDDWQGITPDANVEIVNDAKTGKKAATFTYRAGKQGAWTNVAHSIEQWPKGGNAISFWAKAKKPTAVMLKVNEMRGSHEGFEGFSAKVDIGTEWGYHVVMLKDLQYLWGMGKGNKKLDADNVSTVGFEQEDITKAVAFIVDDIAISRE